MATWCAHTRQPAAAWFDLTNLQKQAFIEVWNDIYKARRQAVKK